MSQQMATEIATTTTRIETKILKTLT